MFSLYLLNAILAEDLNIPAVYEEIDETPSGSETIRVVRHPVKNQRNDISAFNFKTAYQQDPQKIRYARQQEVDSYIQAYRQQQRSPKSRKVEKLPEKELYASSSGIPLVIADKYGQIKIVDPKKVRSSTLRPESYRIPEKTKHKTYQVIEDLYDQDFQPSQKREIKLFLPQDDVIKALQTQSPPQMVTAKSIYSYATPEIIVGAPKANPSYVVGDSYGVVGKSELDALNSLIGKSPKIQLQGLNHLLGNNVAQQAQTYAYPVQQEAPKDYIPITEHVIESVETVKPIFNVQPTQFDSKPRKYVEQSKANQELKPVYGQTNNDVSIFKLNVSFTNISNDKTPTEEIVRVLNQKEERKDTVNVEEIQENVEGIKESIALNVAQKGSRQKINGTVEITQIIKNRDNTNGNNPIEEQMRVLSQRRDRTDTVEVEESQENDKGIKELIVLDEIQKENRDNINGTKVITQIIKNGDKVNGNNPSEEQMRVLSQRKDRIDTVEVEDSQENDEGIKELIFLDDTQKGSRDKINGTKVITQIIKNIDKINDNNPNEEQMRELRPRKDRTDTVEVEGIQENPKRIEELINLNATHIIKNGDKINDNSPSEEQVRVLSQRRDKTFILEVDENQENSKRTKELINFNATQIIKNGDKINGHSPSEEQVRVLSQRKDRTDTLEVEEIEENPKGIKELIKLAETRNRNRKKNIETIGITKITKNGDKTEDEVRILSEGKDRIDIVDVKKIDEEKSEGIKDLITPDDIQKGSSAKINENVEKIQERQKRNAENINELTLPERKEKNYEIRTISSTNIENRENGNDNQNRFIKKEMKVLSQEKEQKDTEHVKGIKESKIKNVKKLRESIISERRNIGKINGTKTNIIHTVKNRDKDKLMEILPKKKMKQRRGIKNIYEVPTLLTEKIDKEDKDKIIETRSRISEDRNIRSTKERKKNRDRDKVIKNMLQKKLIQRRNMKHIDRVVKGLFKIEMIIVPDKIPIVLTPKIHQKNNDKVNKFLNLNTKDSNIKSINKIKNVQKIEKNITEAEVNDERNLDKVVEMITLNQVEDINIKIRINVQKNPIMNRERDKIKKIERAGKKKNINKNIRAEIETANFINRSNDKKEIQNKNRGIKDKMVKVAIQNPGKIVRPQNIRKREQKREFFKKENIIQSKRMTNAVNRKDDNKNIDEMIQVITNKIKRGFNETGKRSVTEKLTETIHTQTNQERNKIDKNHLKLLKPGQSQENKALFVVMKRNNGGMNEINKRNDTDNETSRTNKKTNHRDKNYLELLSTEKDKDNKVLYIISNRSKKYDKEIGKKSGTREEKYTKNIDTIRKNKNINKLDKNYLELLSSEKDKDNKAFYNILNRSKRYDKEIGKRSDTREIKDTKNIDNIRMNKKINKLDKNYLELLSSEKNKGNKAFYILSNRSKRDDKEIGKRSDTKKIKDTKNIDTIRKNKKINKLDKNYLELLSSEKNKDNKAFYIIPNRSERYDKEIFRSDTEEIKDTKNNDIIRTNQKRNKRDKNHLEFLNTETDKDNKALFMILEKNKLEIDVLDKINHIDDAIFWMNKKINKINSNHLELLKPKKDENNKVFFAIPYKNKRNIEKIDKSSSSETITARMNQKRTVIDKNYYSEFLNTEKDKDNKALFTNLKKNKLEIDVTVKKSDIDDDTSRTTKKGKKRNSNYLELLNIEKGENNKTVSKILNKNNRNIHEIYKRSAPEELIKTSFNITRMNLKQNITDNNYLELLKTGKDKDNKALFMILNKNKEEIDITGKNSDDISRTNRKINKRNRNHFELLNPEKDKNYKALLMILKKNKLEIDVTVQKNDINDDTSRTTKKGNKIDSNYLKLLNTEKGENNETVYMIMNKKNRNIHEISPEEIIKTSFNITRMNLKQNITDNNYLELLKAGKDKNNKDLFTILNKNKVEIDVTGKNSDDISRITNKKINKIDRNHLKLLNLEKEENNKASLIIFDKINRNINDEIDKINNDTRTNEKQNITSKNYLELLKTGKAQDNKALFTILNKNKVEIDVTGKNSDDISRTSKKINQTDINYLKLLNLGKEENNKGSLIIVNKTNRIINDEINKIYNATRMNEKQNITAKNYLELLKTGKDKDNKAIFMILHKNRVEIDVKGKSSDDISRTNKKINKIGNNYLKLLNQGKEENNKASLIILNKNNRSINDEIDKIYNATQMNQTQNKTETNHVEILNTKKYDKNKTISMALNRIKRSNSEERTETIYDDTTPMSDYEYDETNIDNNNNKTEYDLYDNYDDNNATIDYEETTVNYDLPVIIEEHNGTIISPVASERRGYRKRKRYPKRDRKTVRRRRRKPKRPRRKLKFNKHFIEAFSSSFKTLTTTEPPTPYTEITTRAFTTPVYLTEESKIYTVRQYRTTPNPVLIPKIDYSHVDVPDFEHSHVDIPRTKAKEPTNVIVINNSNDNHNHGSNVHLDNEVKHKQNLKGGKNNLKHHSSHENHHHHHKPHQIHHHVHKPHQHHHHQQHNPVRLVKKPGISKGRLLFLNKKVDVILAKLRKKDILE